MKKFILSISVLAFTISAFAFDGEISIHYKGNAEAKEDYTLTWHIANGKARLDFYMAATSVTTVFLPQGGNKVILYNIGANQYFSSTIDNIPTVEEYKVSETAETKTVNGFVCTKYVFRSFSSGKVIESWIAKGLNVDWNTIPNTIRMLPESRIMAKYDITGVPLETSIKDENGIASQSNTISVKQTAQPAEIFTVPAGYKAEESVLSK